MSVVNIAEFPDPGVRAPTILIVEDEPLIRLSISNFLQECGFIVLEASNVSEAKECVSQGLKIGLVFSDVQIPGSVDGFGLAIWIRLHRPGMPIILASGYTRIADIAQELCAGAPFFKKPYDLNIVVAKIRQTLSACKTGT